MSGRRVVLGVGNILNRDEGLGVRALERLEQRYGALPGVEYIDGGVLGLSLLPLVEACDYLLILDAVDMGGDPGRVVDMGGDEIRLFSNVRMSEHQITFQEVLGLAFVRGRLPSNLHLLGLQPADLSIGLEMSAPIAARLDNIAAKAVEVLDGWGLVDATRLVSSRD
jgi:hydrogenase maturation protease